MRRICILLAFIAVAASCTREAENVHASAEDNVISFGVAGVGMSVETKAYSESTVAKVKAGGFGVAALNGTTLLFNKTAVWDEAASSYSPSDGPYYWPASGTVDCYAVYPASQAVTVSGSAASLSYAHDGDTDLIAAKVTGAESSSSPVSLTFSHVLSLVKFKAVGSDSNVKYKVKCVKVTVPSSGKYDYASGAWSDTTAKAQQVFSSSVVTLSGTTVIPGTMTVIPCKPAVYVEWETYSPEGDVLIHSYSDIKTLDAGVAMGKESTITLTLPNSSAVGICFTVGVGAWGSESHNMNF